MKYQLIIALSLNDDNFVLGATGATAIFAGYLPLDKIVSNVTPVLNTGDVVAERVFLTLNVI